MIVYARKKSGGVRVLQFSQRNGELPLPWRKQGNYPVITIYDVHTVGGGWFPH